MHACINAYMHAYMPICICKSSTVADVTLWPVSVSSPHPLPSSNRFAFYFLVIDHLRHCPGPVPQLVHLSLQCAVVFYLLSNSIWYLSSSSFFSIAFLKILSRC